MHRHHVLGVELLQLGHDLAQIVVRRRRQVKAADQRVNLLDAADLLGALQGVDDAGMPARADHYEPAAAEPEAGRVLVPMLVRLRLAGQLVCGEVVVHVGMRVAAEPVLDPDLDPGVGQHMLDAGARDRAGREGVALDDDRILGQHRLDVERLQLAAVERTEIGEAAVGLAQEAVAEIVLAAGIEAQILAHLRPPRFEKPDQPAVMVEMPVAEDQRVHLGRVDFQQLEIVGVNIGGEAEIQQIPPLLAASRRFDVQRQAPFAFERLSLRRAAGVGAQHGEAGTFERLQEDVVLVVGDLSHDDAVDDRRLDACGRRRAGRPTPDTRALPSAAEVCKETSAAQRRHVPLRQIVVAAIVLVSGGPQ